MSFRGTNLDIFDLIRNMQERIERLERDVGQARQNTIRMGNWVFEPEADELLRMTNLVTGAVTYVGRPQDEVVIPEITAPDFIPVLSISGVIRDSFTTNQQSLIYPFHADQTVTRLDVTLMDLDTAGVGSGPIFQIKRNGTAVYTSPRITSSSTSFTVNLTFQDGDDVWLEVTDDGLGDASGLAVVFIPETA